MREAEESTGVPCLSSVQIRDGAALTLIGATPTRRPRARVKAAGPVAENGAVRKAQVVRLVT
jgi:hypothetical protein